MSESKDAPPTSAPTTPELFNVGRRYTPKDSRRKATSNKVVRRIFRGLVERLHVHRFKTDEAGKVTVATADNRVGQCLARLGRLRILIGKFAKNSHARRRLFEAELADRRAQRAAGEVDQ